MKGWNFMIMIINFLFASTSQSLQKLFANIVIFTTSIFSAMYYYRNENKKLFIDHLYFVLKLILIHSLISFFIYPFVKPFIFEISNSRYDCYTFLNLFHLFLYTFFGFVVEVFV